jgi:NADH-quinone oxidoreductase subunit I
VYEINMLRCIFCAMCVEACPTEAITMTHLFEMSVVDREEGIFDKDSLLVEPDGTPNHPLPTTPLIDIQELKLGDGWMRATSPSGRAAFEGIEAWTPSARMGGMAPAEPGQGSYQPPATGSQPEDPDSKPEGPRPESQVADPGAENGAEVGEGAS